MFVNCSVLCPFLICRLCCRYQRFLASGRDHFPDANPNHLTIFHQKYINHSVALRTHIRFTRNHTCKRYEGAPVATTISSLPPNPHKHHCMTRRYDSIAHHHHQQPCQTHRTEDEDVTALRFWTHLASPGPSPILFEMRTSNPLQWWDAPGYRNRAYPISNTTCVALYHHISVITIPASARGISPPHPILIASEVALPTKRHLVPGVGVVIRASCEPELSHPSF